MLVQEGGGNEQQSVVHWKLHPLIPTSPTLQSIWELCFSLARFLGRWQRFPQANATFHPTTKVRCLNDECNTGSLRMNTSACLQGSWET